MATQHDSTGEEQGRVRQSLGNHARAIEFGELDGFRSHDRPLHV